MLRRPWRLKKAEAADADDGEEEDEDVLSSSLRGAPCASGGVAAVDTSQCSSATAPAHSQVACVIAAQEEKE